MTYLPFVYLILLSPEQYYTNNLRIQNGYQPMPLDYAKKIDVRDKIQQPVVYLPYVFLSPLKNAALSEDSPDGNNAAAMETGAGAESEGNMDDDINKENVTLSNNDTAAKSPSIFKGYSLIVQNCPDGFLSDENGNCGKGIIRGSKEFELERKKRAITQQQNSSGRMIYKLSKKISVRDKRFAEEKKLSYADIVKYGRRGPPPHAKEMSDTATTSKSPNFSSTTAKTTTIKTEGSRQPTVPSLPPGIPVPSTGTPSNPTKNQHSMKPGDNSKTTSMPSTTAKTLFVPDNEFKIKGHSAPSKPSLGKESSMFINSEAANKPYKKLINLDRRRRDAGKRSAEEGKFSYADTIKYRGGRRPTPRSKEIPAEETTSKNPTAARKKPIERNTSDQPAVLSAAGIPVLSDKAAATSSNPTAKPSTSKEASIPENKSKTETNPVSSKPSITTEISSEGAKKPDDPVSPQENTSPIPNTSSRATTVPPYLYLVTTVCENGYIKDENGNCIKSVKKKHPDKWSAKLERRRRDTDRIKLLKEIIDAEDRIVDKRNPQQKRFYYRFNKQLENDTRKTETAFTSLPNPTLSTEPTPDKNAASDGFGYISKECNKLVPGLVSDGAGGCTKSVKPKEKILQLERRKRQARIAYINFIDPNNALRKNNFTIRITLKGFNKKSNFTGEVKDEPYDDGNKAVAENGFGVTSSKCDNLVPGLVHDGVGGCTKAVKAIRKRNKFSFVLKNVENTQPLIDVEYENPEPELVNSNNNEDPDADII